MSMLNWRRDPGYEHSIVLHEQRMKQLESEILQLRQETARLRQLNAKEKALSESIRRLCFPPESSSIPPIPTAPDCSKPS